MRLGAFVVLSPAFLGSKFDPSGRRRWGAPSALAEVSGNVPGTLPQAMDVRGRWPGGREGPKSNGGVESRRSKVWEYGIRCGLVPSLFHLPLSWVPNLKPELRGRIGVAPPGRFGG